VKCRLLSLLFASGVNVCRLHIYNIYIILWLSCRSELQRRNERLEFERNKERLLFMKVVSSIHS